MAAERELFELSVDWSLMKLIYYATFRERLEDLERACKLGKTLIDSGELRELSEEEKATETLEDMEFAIGDWIVRPRFWPIRFKTESRRRLREWLEKGECKRSES